MENTKICPFRGGCDSGCQLFIHQPSQKHGEGTCALAEINKKLTELNNHIVKIVNATSSLASK
jgi:hypothetical protein